MKDNKYKELLLDRIEYKLMLSSESIDTFIKTALETDTDGMSAEDVQNQYQDLLIMLKMADEVIDGAIRLLVEYQKI